MSDATDALPRRSLPVALIAWILRRLDGIPYALLAIPLRLALAYVFWSSATSRQQDWATTIVLFRDEYRVPLLSPELAAAIVTNVELAASILLVLGFLVRPAAAALLVVMVATDISIYPETWSMHMQWAAILLVLLGRGGGALTLDRLFGRHLGLRPRWE